MAKSKKTKKKKSSLVKQWRQHKLRLLFGVCAFFILIVAVTAYIGARTTEKGRLVTFHDRGESHVILTHAATVRDALKDADITVAPQDDVEPSLNSQISSTDSAVIIYRARPVLIIDGAWRQKVVTPAQSPNEIATVAHITPIDDKDKTTISEGDVVSDGAATVLTIKRAVLPASVIPFINKPTALALSKNKGAQLYTDSSGVTHRETYYDLPMNIVIGACGGGDYTVRYDGAKIDKDGYVLVAASYAVYPRCSIVETSLGLGKVYDTGGFAARYPHGFDLGTDWTDYNGR